MSKTIKVAIAIGVIVVALIPAAARLAQGSRKAEAPYLRDTAPEFVNDPEALGGWVSVDFVRGTEDFKPGQQSWQGDLYLKGLEFRPGGCTSGPWLWSNGVLRHPGDRSIGKYEIKQIDGREYMFMEWISGDVLARGEKPWYYVLTPEAAGQVPISRSGPSSHSQDMAPEFVDDPAALGKWVSVDFVHETEDFKPGQQSWQGGLYLKGLEFRPGGHTSGPWLWSNGVLWHPGDRSIGKYVTKHVGDGEYMFMEWISGDVLIRGQKPWYYVLMKSSL